MWSSISSSHLCFLLQVELLIAVLLLQMQLLQSKYGSTEAVHKH